MLTNLSVTGLQYMNDVANRYIANRGLCFNQVKTEWVMFGKGTLSPHPESSLSVVKLTESERVKYLGVTLFSSESNENVKYRIEACRRAFSTLKGTGFNNANADSDIISFICNSAIRPVLNYGMHVMVKLKL